MIYNNEDSRFSSLLKYRFTNYIKFKDRAKSRVYALKLEVKDLTGNTLIIDGVPGNMKVNGDKKIFNSKAFANFQHKEEADYSLRTKKLRNYGYFSWNSYGTLFKLSVDGELIIIANDPIYQQQYYIYGAKEMWLAGKNEL